MSDADIFHEGMLYFVDNPEINAYAFTRQGRYFIGFFVGTMYLLNTMFSRMLSDRRILPTVGNIQLEAENPQSLQGLPLDAKEACASGFYPSEPQCPVRSWWKGRLTLIAFFFLVKHEITHIADGHVDYWSKRHGTPFLGELGRTGPSESDVLTRQSLEVMADTVLSAILS